MNEHFKILFDLEKSKTCEDLEELITEHERLVKVLKTPSHKDDKKEAELQEDELKEYKQKQEVNKSFDDLFNKAVLMHRLEKDYEQNAKYLEEHPAQNTLTLLAKQDTGKVIDIDKMFNNLINPDTFKGGEGSGRKNHKKVINLTTKQKSEKHFNNLQEAKRKEAIKTYDSKQIDEAYNDLLKKEADENKLNLLDNIFKEASDKIKNTLEQPKTADYTKRQFVKNSIKDLELIAKRIKQKTYSVHDFEKQFMLEVKSVPKYKDLSSKHFTDKQMSRLRDFSLNNIKEKFNV